MAVIFSALRLVMKVVLYWKVILQSSKLEQ